MTRKLRSHFVLCMVTAPLIAVAIMVSACGTSESDSVDKTRISPSGDEQDARDANTTQPDHDIVARVHTAFDDLLSRVVSESGLVHYTLLQEADMVGRLTSIVNGYQEADLPDDQNHRLAFWCNAYNANVLSMIVHAQQTSHPRLASVEDIKGFFDTLPITVAGEEMTLNALESEKIRPLGDPRIHAALVCAAMSCPPLRKEAYRAAKLDEQFDDQCRRWVNDSTKFRAGDDVLKVSEILNWYGDDFTGEPFNGRAAFIAKYAGKDSELVRLLGHDADPSVEYLSYNWSLNDADE